MSKKIKVNITCQEVVYYDQEVEMTQEEFDKLRKADGEDIIGHSKVYHEIEKHIDRQDVYDTGEEWLNFEINKIIE